MATIEVKVPDIGDFEEVAVIELLVKPGDTVKAEQSLVTVESDKASMEIPSSAGRRGEGTQGQARRQGEGRLGACWCWKASGAAAAQPAPAPPAAPAPAAGRNRCRAAAPPAPAPPQRAASVARSKSRVPDIGDFKDVAVIEVLVKPGDTVKVEQSLITVESDKASMEIPSSRGRRASRNSRSSSATRSTSAT